ncbi:MAG: non-canonical purine NTP pyrophosphatase [Synechococcus sp. SB0662_bin_45]|nr:non-canonical purine NTP pyrophosphatase [Synechococcus sp. SB0668_bin_13]MXX08175.1 non-canonical purine NTP pyrophosphatase [Synechococcus sp. SB0667_bin_8]MYE22275.1 non-canonical purine NTP pyrophosphatase [Synechococcus sp. SB0662_bin_45]MYG63073.1 non-canonical purine NTP pyrophosphatase [Synechococcus sp. SB0675_bin_7]MYI71399.1 non-canonical purine NTP pyrophosphatase [Synechococcus sp. SB0673_bin_10]MYK86003.1 non-canonical purine NTP pyrophosphatase [Synechococcus sp. SB0669_bin_7
MLVIASSNAGKVEEIAAMLGPMDIRLGVQPGELVVEETGSSFAENARLKAATVARFTGAWSLADDSGLVVDALNGAPGVYSARYGPDAASRQARLLAELKGSLYRAASLVSALALANPLGEILLETQGECRGEILEQPRGTAKGYGDIFWIRAAGCTYGELPTSQRLKFGSRGRAVRSVAADIKRLLNLRMGLHEI